MIDTGSVIPQDNDVSMSLISDFVITEDRTLSTISSLNLNKQNISEDDYSERHCIDHST